LSALSLMHRAALMAVALALATTASAQGAHATNAHATEAAKTQRRIAATTYSPVPARPVHSQTRSGTHSGTHSGRYSGRTASMSAAGRRTPDEVGRSAGLAIREQRALRLTGHSVTAARVWQAHYGRRSRIRSRIGSRMGPRLERTALRPEARSATRRFETIDASGADSVPDARTAVETDEVDGDAERHADVGADHDFDGAREQSAAELREARESADVETAPTERASRSETAGANVDNAANVEAASRQGEGADTRDYASTRTNDEVASLLMPRRGMPAPLRGSLASLQRQNDRVDAEGLERIEDEADLSARIADKLLVPLPASNALTVNSDLEENHRYCRPWTAKFLADLARAHETAFHRSIEVSSAVRTVAYQKRLMETNGNAAPAEGDLVSPHLTGATVDIAKKGLSRAEIAWMRQQLADLQTAGKIDVEEEFKQSCFHITVYKNYVPARNSGEATPAKAVAGGATTRSEWPQMAQPADVAQGE